MKYCKKCDTVKTLAEFSRRTHPRYDGVEEPKAYASYCKVCMSHRSSEWYDKQLDKTTLNKQRYSRLDKAKQLESATNWRRANPEKRAEIQRRYRINNRWQQADANNRRRARIAENGFESYRRDDIYDRDAGICYLCSESIDLYYSFPHPKSFSIDHVTPVSKGGADAPSNVKASHLRCNQIKNDKVA